MELIYFKGLNCKDAAIVNIAAHLGIDFTKAFSHLWSETEFIYDSVYGIYTSKKLLLGYEENGIKPELLLHSKNNIEDTFLDYPDDELFVVGMDVFHIPWHILYGHFHDPHFFFAEKKGDSFICHDPIYKQLDIKLKSEAIFGTAFEINRVCRRTFATGDTNPLKKLPQDSLIKLFLSEELQSILANSSTLKDELIAKIKRARGYDQIGHLIKYVTAIINNRYLFGHYLKKLLSSENFKHSYIADNDNLPIFCHAFYQKWEAVKNGLYKVQIKKDNAKVIDEVCLLVHELFDKEIQFAQENIQ